MANAVRKHQPLDDMPAQIAAVAVNYDVDQFLAGQRDCKEGVPHKAGRSESYDRGYAVQYEWEQIQGI